MDIVIQTHQLCKAFGNHRVLDRLDLAVPQGAIFALLGDNGAGKSTTIRILTGLLPADAGSATLFGRDCWSSAIELRHRVGYVPERPRYYDWMSVDELGSFTAGFHRPGFLDRYRRLTERFSLDRKARLKNLSKGGYAKVGLALALAIDPEVLILDEPTSGLDLFTRKEFLNSMVDLAGEGRTILISSHSVAEIERVASHVAFLAPSELLLSGPLEELRRRMIRVRVRHDGSGYSPEGIGIVLDRESSSREWLAVILDPDRTALADLAHRRGVVTVEEESLTLEEMYTSLLARFHHADQRNTAPLPVAVEKGDRR